MDGSKDSGAVAAGQIVGIGLAMFLGVVIAAVAVAKATLPAPRVGDIMVMRSAGDLVAQSLEVRRVAADGSLGSTCVLDSDMMAASGGSLIVEGQVPSNKPRYLVHWAGGPTSKPGTDCGHDADLALETQEVVRLSHAAVNPGALRIPVAATLNMPVAVN